jgi:rare lipoprotein A
MSKLIISIFITFFPVQADQTGKISYYGEGNWHGSVMANGEQFNPHAPVCASRSLPFGTVLAIKNESNNRIAFCKVKDRGPFDIVDGKPLVNLDSKYERILDVSVGVASELKMRDEGIVKANIYILSSKN